MTANPKTSFADIAFNDRTKELIDAIDGITKVNAESNELEIDNFEGNIWEKFLPKTVTKEAVNDLNEYRKDLGLATSNVFGRKIVEHAMANDDIGQMECRVETPDVDFGFSYARPTAKKLTRQHHRNSITSYTKVARHSLEIENRNALADLWSLED